MSIEGRPSHPTGEHHHSLSKSLEHRLIWAVGMVRTPEQTPEMLEKYRGRLEDLGRFPEVKAEIDHLMVMPTKDFRKRWDDVFRDERNSPPKKR